MNIQDQFLADILVNPDDDAPRLVFHDWLQENEQWEWNVLTNYVCEHVQSDQLRLLCAQWLEEHGHTSHSDFIKMQLEIARMDPKSPTECRRFNDLMFLTADILATDSEGTGNSNHCNWFERRPRCHMWGYRRGFVSSITIASDDFLVQAGEMFKTQPILEVVLPDLAPLLDMPDYPDISEASWYHEGWPSFNSDDRSNLPNDLYARLQDGVEIEEYSNGMYYRIYNNEQLADADLVRACITFGRKRAELIAPFPVPTRLISE